MTTLLTNARLIDPEALTDTPCNLLIENGLFAGIGDIPAPKGAIVIDCGRCRAAEVG